MDFVKSHFLQNPYFRNQKHFGLHQILIHREFQKNYNMNKKIHAKTTLIYDFILVWNHFVPEMKTQGAILKILLY